MAAFDGTATYAESDADDEYERSMHGDHSPVGDSEASPVDSELSMGTVSTEHTPTYDAHGGRSSSAADRLPETIITDWTADECADFIGSIGLEQYADAFIENEIVGEALVALLHDDLKSMGISSVGHRLTILKSVYDVKKAQDVPFESDQYLPLSADAEAQYETATLKDIKQLVEQLRLRDERMNLLEQDLRRMTDDFRRLREDMLPALRLVKDAQQPLPNLGGGGGGGMSSAQSTPAYSYDGSTLSPPAPTPTPPGGSGVKRQYSQRKILIGAMPKSTSPTQQTHERSIAEQTLDPAGAAERAVLSSSHLAAMNGSGPNSSGTPPYPSPNMPSPTSPHTQMNTLASRSYRAADAPPPTSRSDADYSTSLGPSSSVRDKTTSSSRGGGGGGGGGGNMGGGAPPQRRETPAPPETPGGSGGGSANSNASVEIFKSFRVSMDDPCHKVLPAALKKYQINAPWDQYALYIVYGDQERCLGMDEKPLILFKQLDKEGKKPMFMLRKTTSANADGDAVPGTTTTLGGGSGGGIGGSNRGNSTYEPPGGII